MTEVIKWLRSQMGKLIGGAHSPADVVWNNAVKMCVSKVDEAEVRLENEVCEWKQNRLNPDFMVQHKRFIKINKEYKFCPYCGKKIKIVEVE